MQHLEEGQIHAWLDGALGDDEAAAVARHAAECSDCAAMVAEARGLVAGASRIIGALDVTRGGVIPPVPARPASPAGAPRSIWHRLRMTPARLAIAATVIVAVGSLLTVRSAPVEKDIAVDSKPILAPITTAPASPATTTSDTLAAVPPQRRLRVDTKPRARASVASAPSGPPSVVDSLRSVAGGVANPARAMTDTAARDAMAKTMAREVAAAAPPTKPVIADSFVGRAAEQRALSANVARAGAAGGARGAAAPAALRLSEVVATNANATAFADRRRGDAAVPTVCYAFPSAMPSWASSIPRRFALDGMRAMDTSTTRLLVRHVTAEGKIDGPVAGSWWQRAGRDSLPANVTWTAGDARGPITLQLVADAASRALRGTLSDPARSEPVAVSITTCSP